MAKAKKAEAAAAAAPVQSAEDSAGTHSSGSYASWMITAEV